MTQTSKLMLTTISSILTQHRSFAWRRQADRPYLAVFGSQKKTARSQRGGKTTLGEKVRSLPKDKQLGT